MVINPICSGSSGNAYLIDTPDTHILLDCGLTLDSLQRYMWSKNRRVMHIDACLVTHEHKDHSRLAQTLLDLGIPVYASWGTIEECNLHGDRLYDIQGDLKSVDVCGTTVRAFDVEHDAKEPLGFIISAFSENLLYVTDTSYIKYSFNNLDYIMIECNHSQEIIRQNAQKGEISVSHLKRVVQNHMSVESCCKWLERCDRSKLKEVYLLHLSNDNSDEQEFKKRVQEIVGVHVIIC